MFWQEHLRTWSHFRWDWMVFSGASLKQQIVIDLLGPLLIVLLYRTPRFYTLPRAEDTSAPEYMRNSWKYLLVILYGWFFSATFYGFFMQGR